MNGAETTSTFDFWTGSLQGLPSCTQLPFRDLRIITWVTAGRFCVLSGTSTCPHLSCLSIINVTAVLEYKWIYTHVHKYLDRDTASVHSSGCGIWGRSADSSFLRTSLDLIFPLSRCRTQVHPSGITDHSCPITFEPFITKDVVFKWL